ncbi:MAG: hypothetical protein HYU05_00885 [Candidatus Wildermuthbacteria bacterium]|nr:hypothetical protein [Candidatus Wildermuthbacteria bacterium]MBI2121236.1 hypothetical protein [Candidatus Wildermuthbacteria bacterium]MBI2647762.1 hypothetical protein [Candidatus Wildermuthbacteria bacterium]
MNDAFLTFLLVVGAVFFWWFTLQRVAPESPIANELSRVSVTFSSPGPAIQDSSIPLLTGGALLR